MIPATSDGDPPTLLSNTPAALPRCLLLYLFTACVDTASALTHTAVWLPTVHTLLPTAFQAVYGGTG